MKYLVIIVGGLILRFGGSIQILQQDGWYRRLNEFLRARLGGKTNLVLWLSLLLPTLLVFLLQGWLGRGLIGFAFSLLIFLYCLGRGDLQQQIDEYKADLQRDDLQAAFHDEAVFNAAHQESQADNYQELHDQAVAAIAYRYFEHFFAVIFWFMLVGPVGALLYRLTQLRVDMILDQEDKSRAMEQLFLQLLEWLPVRIFGAMLAFVGDFTRVFRYWTGTLSSLQQSSQELLGQYTRGALGLDDGEVRQAAEIAALQALLYRAMVCAVTLIALWVILG